MDPHWFGSLDPVHNIGLNESICLITPDFSAISHTEKYSPSYGKNGLCLVQKLTYPFEHSTGYGKVQQCGVVLHCTVWYHTGMIYYRYGIGPTFSYHDLYYITIKSGLLKGTA